MEYPQAYKNLNDKAKNEFRGYQIACAQLCGNSHYKMRGFVTIETENEYNAFIVNRAMGFGPDTVIAGNEMNSRPHIDKKMQYDFLKAVVRKRRRYNKWLKSEEENIEAIQKFFKYSFIKAKETLNLLNETDIDRIKLFLNTSKGGKI